MTLVKLSVNYEPVDRMLLNGTKWADLMNDSTHGADSSAGSTNIKNE